MTTHKGLDDKFRVPELGTDINTHIQLNDWMTFMTISRTCKNVKLRYFMKRAHGSHRSWHIFSRTFEVHLQGVLRTFLCSFKHPFAKKWSTMDFSNKTYRDNLILSSPKNGGGRHLGMCLTFLDDLLYYSYNTTSNNSAWKGGGGLGVLSQKMFIRINPADTSGGCTSLVIMSQSE